MAKTIEINKGDRYGKATILSPAPDHVYPNGAKRRQFWMRCDCGSAPFISNINNLRTGTSTSCGCARKTHGMYNTRQYQCWADMKTRCDNPEHQSYSDYGGRGITYPEKWSSFEGFWEDMAEGYEDSLTINRVDNDAPYSKENCIWDIQGNQNHMRRKRKGSYLGVIGGIYDKKDGRMYAKITHEKTHIFLGEYETEEEIAEAYDCASEKLYNDRPNKTLETRDVIKNKVVRYLARKGH